MVSARRKYPGVADHSAHPVQSPPASEATAKVPDAVEPQSAEPIEAKPTPAEEAAKSAIKQRLEEAQRAQHLVQEQAAQYAAEPEAPQMDERDQFEAAIQHLPPRIQAWYRNDPSWLTDPERAACITYAHHVSLRETGSVGSDDYYRRMESLMGLRDASPEPSPERSRASELAPRQYSGAPVSAPPSRESHSMATGRPVDRVSLSHEEAALAKSLGLTSQQYLDGKARMLREKQGGFHRDE
jgi:hypothetical protein